MKWELAGTSEFCAFASTMPKCASVEGSGLLEIVQVAPSVPSWASVFVYTVLTFAVPLKPPATMTNALVFDDCTATARSPARGLGSGVGVVRGPGGVGEWWRVGSEGTGGGGGGGVRPPPPPQPTTAREPMAPKTNKPNRWIFVRMLLFSFCPLKCFRSL